VERLLGSALALLAIGCSVGGGSGDVLDGPGGDSGPGKIGDGSTGIEVSGYPGNATVGPSGGVVEMPGGPEIGFPAGALGADAGIGIGPAADPPPVPSGWTSVSGWYDVVTSRSGVVAKPGLTVVMGFPADPPAAAIGQPGLQVLAALPDRVVAIDGTYDAKRGAFQVEVTGLPPKAAYCVAWNPRVKRLSSGSAVFALTGEAQSPLAGGWASTDWTIDYDGQSMTEDQAKDLLKWAKESAKFYSDEGFKEPTLYREPAAGGASSWRMHLIAARSNYDPNFETLGDEGARVLGRLNLDVSDAVRGASDPGAGGKAVFAHELFHAIFQSYGVKTGCFEFTDTADPAQPRYCYPSDSGFNEGMATAVGIWLEKGGEPAPWPMAASTLEMPHGHFDVSDQDASYRNQDFFVYLLRMGGIGALRRHLETIATAATPSGSTSGEMLAAYAAVLEGANIGWDAKFHEVYATYVADRGYVRTSAGHVWPDEPHGDIPGESNAWDPTLFPNPVKPTKDDCKVTEQGATCTITVEGVPPYAARAVLLDFTSDGHVPPGYEMAGLDAKFKASTTTGQVSLLVYGEKDGKGSDEGRVGSLDGAEVELKSVIKDWNMGKVYLVHGSGEPANLTLTITIGVGESPDACKEWADWMCKCNAGGQPCWVYEYATQQACANVPAGKTCDDVCTEGVQQYQAAYAEPEVWAAMGCTGG